MEDLTQIYYSEEQIELLHETFDNLSPEFWHHVTNPYCPICLEEQGRAFIEECLRGST